ERIAYASGDRLAAENRRSGFFQHRELGPFEGGVEVELSKQIEYLVSLSLDERHVEERSGKRVRRQYRVAVVSAGLPKQLQGDVRAGAEPFLASDVLPEQRLRGRSVELGGCRKALPVLLGLGGASGLALHLVPRLRHPAGIRSQEPDAHLGRLDELGEPREQRLDFGLLDPVGNAGYRYIEARFVPHALLSVIGQLLDLLYPAHLVVADREAELEVVGRCKRRVALARQREHFSRPPSGVGRDLDVARFEIADFRERAILLNDPLPLRRVERAVVEGERDAELSRCRMWSDTRDGFQLRADAGVRRSAE